MLAAGVETLQTDAVTQGVIARLDQVHIDAVAEAARSGVLDALVVGIAGGGNAGDADEAAARGDDRLGGRKWAIMEQTVTGDGERDSCDTDNREASQALIHAPR